MSEVLPKRRSEKTNNFSRLRIALDKSAFSFSRLQNPSPLTTPPYSKGFLVLRIMRYALCIIEAAWQHLFTGRNDLCCPPLSVELRDGEIPIRNQMAGSRTFP